jgi:ParB family chromosome partitioning protein
MAKKQSDIQARLGQRTALSADQAAIDRLMTSATGDVQASDLDLKAIRLDRIIPDPNQPRRSMPAETLEDLAASIREQGVIQPIEVDYDPDQDVYVLVHGERRWKASKMAGLETIPAIVKPSRLDRATRLIRQLIENIQREDLNDVDRARALVSLRDQMQAELTAQLQAEEPPDSDKATWKTQVTWAQVGQRVGISRARMSQLRALLDLPDAIREDVRRGLLTERDSRSYRGLPPEQQRDLHRAWREQGLTAAEVQEAATVLKVEAKTPEPRSVDEVVALVTAPPPPPPEEPVEETRPETPPGEVTEPTPLPTAEPVAEAPPATTPPPAAQPTASWEDRLVQVRDSLQELESLDIRPDSAEVLLSLIKDIRSVLTLVEERISTTL